MPQRDKVVLRVRAYGQEGLEFALSGVNISEKRYTAIYCLISAFILVVGGLLSSVKWGVIPSARLFVGLLLLTFSAAWMAKATGSVIVEGMLAWILTVVGHQYCGHSHCCYKCTNA